MKRKIRKIFSIILIFLMTSCVMCDTSFFSSSGTFKVVEKELVLNPAFTYKYVLATDQYGKGFIYQVYFGFNSNMNLLKDSVYTFKSIPNTYYIYDRIKKEK